MPNASTYSVNKILIERTEEPQEPIAARHPEFNGQWDLTLKVIMEPEEIYAILEPDAPILTALKRINYLTNYTVVYYKETYEERGFTVTILLFNAPLCGMKV